MLLNQVWYPSLVNYNIKSSKDVAIRQHLIT